MIYLSRPGGPTDGVWFSAVVQFSLWEDKLSKGWAQESSDLNDVVRILEPTDSVWFSAVVQFSLGRWVSNGQWSEWCYLFSAVCAHTWAGPMGRPMVYGLALLCSLVWDDELAMDSDAELISSLTVSMLVWKGVISLWQTRLRSVSPTQRSSAALSWSCYTLGMSTCPPPYVRDAGRGGGCLLTLFTRSLWSPALSRSADHHAFLPVTLGLSGKPVTHVSHVGRAGRIRGLPSHTVKMSSSSSAPSRFTAPLLLNGMFASSGKSLP